MNLSRYELQADIQDKTSPWIESTDNAKAPRGAPSSGPLSPPLRGQAQTNTRPTPDHVELSLKRCTEFMQFHQEVSQLIAHHRRDLEARQHGNTSFGNQHAA